MTISLNRDQQHFVEELVASGRFGSASSALEKAIELLKEDHRLFEELRRQVEIGLADAERGDLVDAEDVFAELKRAHEAEYGPQDWCA